MCHRLSSVAVSGPPSIRLRPRKLIQIVHSPTGDVHTGTLDSVRLNRAFWESGMSEPGHGEGKSVCSDGRIGGGSRGRFCVGGYNVGRDCLRPRGIARALKPLRGTLGCLSSFRIPERTALHLSPRLYAKIRQMANAVAAQARRYRAAAPGLADQGGGWGQ